jgi:hypothetical protein
MVLKKKVFRATHEQMMKSLEQSNSSTNWTDPIVRLRGLPFNCTKEELAKFFDGTFRNCLIIF